MACPQTQNCLANTTIALDGFLFTNEDYADNGDVFLPGNEERPNFSTQRGNDGTIKSINGSDYIMGSPSLRLNPCTPAYLALHTAWVGGQSCFDTLVINNPCCDSPGVYTDVVITNMERPGISIDDVYSSVEFEGKVVS